jgi:hypothetical protein
MLFEYKIQKIEDGNGEVSFTVLMSRVSTHRWWRSKQWKECTTYLSTDDAHPTLSSAQSTVKKQMDSDARTEYRENKNKTKILKEFVYTEIPDHISEEQEEKFCDLSEVKI